MYFLNLYLYMTQIKRMGRNMARKPIIEDRHSPVMDARISAIKTALLQKSYERSVENLSGFHDIFNYRSRVKSKRDGKESRAARDAMNTVAPEVGKAWWDSTCGARNIFAEGLPVAGRSVRKDKEKRIFAEGVYFYGRPCPRLPQQTACASRLPFSQKRQPGHAAPGFCGRGR